VWRASSSANGGEDRIRLAAGKDRQNFEEGGFMENSDIVLQILAGVFIGLLIKRLFWH